jgi:hypothetical protein
MLGTGRRAILARAAVRGRADLAAITDRDKEAP